MKELFVVLTCGVFLVAGLCTVPETATKQQRCECRCNCYWRGKEDGRIEVRNANAELLKPQEQEWPEGTEKPWWADMPAVN